MTNESDPNEPKLFDKPLSELTLKDVGRAISTLIAFVTVTTLAVLCQQLNWPWYGWIFAAIAALGAFFVAVPLIVVCWWILRYCWWLVLIWICAKVGDFVGAVFGVGLAAIIYFMIELVKDLHDSGKVKAEYRKIVEAMRESVREVPKARILAKGLVLCVAITLAFLVFGTLDK